MTVPAQIDGERVPTGCSERHGSTPPGMPGLAAAMQQHHRSAPLVTESISDEVDTLATQGQRS
jgi:hypothetical protein